MEDIKHTALTLLEAKDKIAQKYGHASWGILCYRSSEVVIDSKHDEACELLTASLTSELKAKEEELNGLRERYATSLKSANEEITRLKGTLGVEAVRQNMDLKEEKGQMITSIVNAQTNANTIEDTHQAFDFLQSSLNEIVESALSKPSTH